MRTLTIIFSIYFLMTCKDTSKKTVPTGLIMSEYFKSKLGNANKEMNGLDLSYAVVTDDNDFLSFLQKNVYHVPSQKLSYKVLSSGIDSVVVLKHFINDSIFFRLDSIVSSGDSNRNIVYYYSDSIKNDNQMVITMSIDSLNRIRTFDEKFGNLGGQEFYDSLDEKANPIASYFEGKMIESFINQYREGFLIKKTILDQANEIIGREEYEYTESGELKLKRIYESELVSLIVYGDSKEDFQFDLIYGKFPSEGEDPVYHPWFNEY